MDKFELEFSEANEKAQEYLDDLDARKDELSSLATAIKLQKAWQKKGGTNSKGRN